MFYDKAVCRGAPLRFPFNHVILHYVQNYMINFGQAPCRLHQIVFYTRTVSE